MGREVAVVLFTDLVGSTELWGQLGEAAEEVRPRHDQIRHQPVDGHGGPVPPHRGDRAMATFPGASVLLGDLP